MFVSFDMNGWLEKQRSLLCHTIEYKTGSIAGENRH